MSEQARQIRIYAAIRTEDVMAYLEAHANGPGEVDIEATLSACEQAITAALATVHPEAWIVVRRPDEHALNPPRTHVESDDASIDLELVGQEVDDLIAEFDITECVVYRG